MWNHLAIFTDKSIYLYQFFDLPISGSDEKMSILHQIKISLEAKNICHK